MCLHRCMCPRAGLWPVSLDAEPCPLLLLSPHLMFVLRAQVACWCHRWCSALAVEGRSFSRDSSTGRSQQPCPLSARWGISRRLHCRRDVAVKRVLREYWQLAQAELGSLVRSDDHPNIVRCFGVEEDPRFVYLALERCQGSLAALMADQTEARTRLLDADGRPSPLCESLLRDMCSGLAALHKRGIVHRDLKPHNVLLTEGGTRAKISDLGLARQMRAQEASFETALGTAGSAGWQPPEVLRGRADATDSAVPGTVRLHRSVDVFSLGLLLFHCATGGLHPFGDGSVERDAGILTGEPDLSPLHDLPELMHLVAGCLLQEPRARPSAAAVCCHPALWTPERRLQFLLDLSNHMETEDRAGDRALLDAMESFALEAAGPNWVRNISQGLRDNLGKYRRYDGSSVRDLLRIIRNKHQHYRELPSELQAALGDLPKGYLAYFSRRFPLLVLAMWAFALGHLSAVPSLQPFLPREAREWLTIPRPAVEPPPPEEEAQGMEEWEAHASHPQIPDAGRGDIPLPRRPGELACQFFLRTGTCSFGSKCRFDHPPEHRIAFNSRGYPLRPLEPPCTFYLKRGECKYGPTCKFNHPEA